MKKSKLICNTNESEDQFEDHKDTEGEQQSKIKKKCIFYWPNCINNLLAKTRKYCLTKNKIQKQRAERITQQIDGTIS